MVTLSMGIRHGFGLFNLPITSANGWGRETFALTIALQNLVWGAIQPITGALADRYGALKIMVAGGVLYALGLAGMAVPAKHLHNGCWRTESILLGFIGQACSFLF